MSSRNHAATALFAIVLLVGDWQLTTAHAAPPSDVAPIELQTVGDVRSLAWFPDGQRLALLIRNGGVNSVEVWQVTPRKRQHILTQSAEAHFCVAIPSDGKSVACVKWRDYPGIEGEPRKRISEVLRWDAETGERLNGLMGPPPHDSPVEFGTDLLRVAYSPDSKYLAGCGKLVSEGRVVGSHLGGGVCVWDTTTEKLIWTNHVTHTDILRGVAFSPDGSALASGGDDKLIRIWDPTSGELKRTLLGVTWDGVLSMDWSRDGRLLATGGFGREEGGVVRVWEIETGNVAHTFVAFTSNSPVRKVSFSRKDDRLFAIGLVNDDPMEWQLKCWDVRTGRPLNLFLPNAGFAHDFAVSPNANWCAVSVTEPKAELLLIPLPTQDAAD